MEAHSDGLSKLLSRLSALGLGFASSLVENDAEIKALFASDGASGAGAGEAAAAGAHDAYNAAQLASLERSEVRTILLACEDPRSRAESDARFSACPLLFLRSTRLRTWSSRQRTTQRSGRLDL